MKWTFIPVLLGVLTLAAPGLAQITKDEGQATEPVPRVLDGPAPLNPDVEIAFWQSVQDSDNPMLYLAYLDQFPDGAFRVIARNRLDALWTKSERAFEVLGVMGMAFDEATADWFMPVPQPTPGGELTVPPRDSANQAPQTTPKPPSVQLVRNTQNQLRAHRCYKGVVDGIWGAGSEAAMRRFNRRAGTSWPVMRPTLNALNSMRALTKSGIRICG